MKIQCICPPKADGTPRHAEDTITLAKRLDFRGALAIRNAIAAVAREDKEADEEDYGAALYEYYLLYGVESWSLVEQGDRGKLQPIPVTRGTIREYLMADFEQALLVANEADELYRAQVVDPLVKAASASSQPTPTTDSTSAEIGSASETPKRSKRSSTSTTRMAVIDPTTSLRDGDSNSSQNSASAA